MHRRLVFLLLILATGCFSSGPDSKPDAAVVTFNLVGTPAPAGVRNVIFCLTQLIVKVDADEEDLPANAYGLGLAWSPIDPLGTRLGGVFVPKGTYRRVDIQLTPNCQNIPARPAVQFINDNDLIPFRMTDAFVMKFVGEIQVDGNMTVNLDISEYFAAMAPITLSSQILPAFSAIEGKL